jgi:hypothetical protein
MTTATLPAGVRQFQTRNTTPSPVDLMTLTDWEAKVVFYAIDYHPAWDEYLNGLDIVRLTAEATAFANRLGIDAIRDIAALVEYARHTGDNAILNRFVPDYHRLESARTVLNGYRRWSTARQPIHIGKVAALSARWTQVTTESPTRAVAE